MNGADGSPTGTCNYNNPGETPDTNSTLIECDPADNGSTFTPDTYGDCNVNGTVLTCVTKTTCTTTPDNGTFTGYYNFLSPLPGVGIFDPTSTAGPNSLGRYLNPMITIFIGICGVLAVIMILMGGIEYMTSELVSSKEAGKERIRDALFGLLLALGAWTLLYTLNPDLLKSDVTVPDESGKVGLSQEKQIASLGQEEKELNSWEENKSYPLL